ncbi:MAG TPA: hypothetical protein VMT16_07180 [Thermoanaerobaculia bacterium]|nr:hypothetical protein [Thermoanaerobaculia bacterium]
MPTPPTSLLAVARPLACCAALLLAALAPAAAALPLLGLGSPPVVQVEVREDPAADTWRAFYRLPSAAHGVEFVRARGAFRALAWGATAVAGEPRWVVEGDRERLCFERPTRSFAVAFRTDFRPRHKDYEVNVPFADGGRLLYTGHLRVRPLDECEAAPGAGGDGAEAVAAPHHRWRFVTEPDRRVRVVDREGRGELAWEPPPDDERGADIYVYFGTLAAQETDRAVLLLDPALPEWLARDVGARLPVLFDHYAAVTGVELPYRPLVLLSAGARGDSGTSFSGGTLDGLVQVAVEGAGWSSDDEETRRFWFHHLAHEVFHLWDGQLLRYDDESEWLSEAAAELFAFDAGLRFGFRPPGGPQAWVIAKANQCLVDLGPEALLAAPASRGWDAVYSCGPVLLFVADRVVERAHPGVDGLSLLFREMFAEARATSGEYGTGVFLGWLDKLGGDRDAVHALQSLIRRGLPHGLDRFLAHWLRHAGVPAALVPPESTAPPGDALGGLLRLSLVRCACGSALPGDEGAGEECAALGAGRLQRVDEVDARRDPGAALGSLRSAVTLQRPLRVVVDPRQEPLLLLCGPDALAWGFASFLALD